jgi:hypothetical protein
MCLQRLHMENTLMLQIKRVLRTRLYSDVHLAWRSLNLQLSGSKLLPRASSQFRFNLEDSGSDLAQLQLRSLRASTKP